MIIPFSYGFCAFLFRTESNLKQSKKRSRNNNTPGSLRQTLASQSCQSYSQRISFFYITSCNAAHFSATPNLACSIYFSLNINSKVYYAAKAFYALFVHTAHCFGFKIDVRVETKVVIVNKQI